MRRLLPVLLLFTACGSSGDGGTSGGDDESMAVLLHFFEGEIGACGDRFVGAQERAVQVECYDHREGRGQKTVDRER